MIKSRFFFITCTSHKVSEPIETYTRTVNNLVIILDHFLSYIDLESTFVLAKFVTCIFIRIISLLFNTCYG